MKKILVFLVCAVLALSLAACGGGTAGETAPDLEPMAPVESAAPAEAASPDEPEPIPAELPEGDASPVDAEEAPASPTDAVIDEAAFAAAEGCVGRPVEALYEAVGEPDEAQYAASCLEEGAQDGMLFYDGPGFYVWTVKTESEEVVHEVYPLD